MATSRRSPRSKPSTATLVLLVRHGLTATTGAVLPGRAPGLHLSGDGRAQAERTAERIAALGPGVVAAVYASPLERTRETAAPIARATGCRVRRNAGLLECDFGAWTGRRLDELRKEPGWAAVQRHPSGFRFPEGESFAEMHQRITSALRQLASRHPGQTIVAVSHADPIKAAIADAAGSHLDSFQRVVVSPCSVSAILYDTTGTLLLAANSTGSLAELTPS